MYAAAPRPRTAEAFPAPARRVFVARAHPMRKTYRPIARAEQAAQVYRKCTLGLNGDLRVHQDPDELENIEEYWDTATNVIANHTLDSIDVAPGDSSAVPDEPPVAALAASAPAPLLGAANGSAPARHGFGPLVQVHSQETRAAPATAVPADTSFASAQSDTLFDLQHIRRSIRASDVAPSKRLTLKPADHAHSALDTAADLAPADTSFAELDMGADAFSADNSGLAAPPAPPAPPSTAESDAPAVAVVFPPDETLDETLSVAETPGEESAPAVLQMPRATRVFKKPRRAPTAVQRRGIECVDSAACAAPNVVAPLVCTDRLDTALMSLDHMAYTRDEVAERPFALFGIRGRVEVRVDGELAVLVRGTTAVVAEGSTYSVTCVSRDGAALFVCYAL